MHLQDLASHSNRAEPLHVVAPVNHPRTLELVNFVTKQSCSRAVTGQHVIGAVKAVTGDPQYASGDSGMSRGQDGSVALNVDVLLPDELLSGLLTQVSVQPELLSVMNDLFDAEGTPCFGASMSIEGYACLSMHITAAPDFLFLRPAIGICSIAEAVVPPLFMGDAPCWGLVIAWLSRQRDEALNATVVQCVNDHFIAICSALR